MNIPPWLIELTLIGIGVFVFYLYRRNDQILEKNKAEAATLIAENKAADAEARKEIREEMKELKAELHSRVSNSEEKLLAAIEKIPDNMVSTVRCDGDQKVWGVRFESLVKSIEVAGETRAKADLATHSAFEETLLKVVTEVKQLADCVTNLANKKEC